MLRRCWSEPPWQGARQDRSDGEWHRVSYKSVAEEFWQVPEFEMWVNCLLSACLSLIVVSIAIKLDFTKSRPKGKIEIEIKTDGLEEKQVFSADAPVVWEKDLYDDLS